MPVRYEMTPEQFEIRMTRRRQERTMQRFRRKMWNATILIVGAALAYYVIEAIVWGVM